MNCNDFETKVTDLARAQMIDAEARDRALAHAATCRRCAARLGDEQRLTAGLRELAATFDDEQMPAGAAAQLLAAFREAHHLAPAAKPVRRRLAWAAAAVILIGLMALAAVRFVGGRRAQPTLAQQPTPQESAPPSAPQAPPPVQIPTPHHQRRAPGRAPQEMARKQDGAARPPAPQPPQPSPVGIDEQAGEIATSFIPLSNGRSLAAAESMQLVRVELPRSALVSFGLPMNVERADERVKADVLIGNDGVARAIRFVR
ncbi:MAG TPA: hypothetical protein VKA60_16120 [Blastocatellia bacterium]|nr:hypothetical protein [Blastocatellia bacterium]